MKSIVVYFSPSVAEHISRLKPCCYSIFGMKYCGFAITVCVVAEACFLSY